MPVLKKRESPLWDFGPWVSPFRLMWGVDNVLGPCGWGTFFEYAVLKTWSPINGILGLGCRFSFDVGGQRVLSPCG
jgi:hypothetical protein